MGCPKRAPVVVFVVYCDCIDGYIEIMKKLKAISPEKIEELATSDDAQGHHVREFLSRVEGLTLDEALALVDSVRYRLGWNGDTYMSVIEGIEEARVGPSRRLNHDHN